MGNKEYKKESERWKSIETELMNKSDVNITLSIDEQKVMNSLVPGNKAIVMPIFAYKKPIIDDKYNLNEQADILFVGGFNHRPNEDGILWFMEKIWPLFKEHNESAKFFIAGSNPTEKIKNFASKDVEITGYISDDDLSELYARCRICVLPLRFGGGVKGKLIEAMHNGIGIVSTPIGIEGLPNIEKCISGKDNATDFAEEMIKLYNDAEYLTIKKQLYGEYMSEYFSLEKLEEKIKHIFS